MAKHRNFFESLAEAQMRLQCSYVLYEDEPYFVRTVSDHKADGKFRVYMEPLPTEFDPNIGDSLQGDYKDYPTHDGVSMDKYADSDKYNLVRKFATSRHFNKFRPFPLGMVNFTGRVIYCERSPTRNMNQGLTSRAVKTHEVQLVPIGKTSPDAERLVSGRHFSYATPEFRDCIMGNYPSFEECLAAVTSKDSINSGAAFDREFALLRGPVDTTFIAYKQDFVGVLPNRDNSLVVLGKEFAFLKEKIQTLGVFNEIATN